jgi:hypothetical protein
MTRDAGSVVLTCGSLTFRLLPLHAIAPLDLDNRRHLGERALAARQLSLGRT